MSRKRQIHAKIEWLAKQARLCASCPQAGDCPYRDQELGNVIASTDEKIIYSNQPIAAALGYTEEGIVGVSTKKVTANFSWPLHLHQRECVRRWKMADFRKWMVPKNGTLIPMHVSVRADYERGEPVYVAFMSRMCPVVQKIEDYRPVRYPRLVAVNCQHHMSL